MTGLHLLLIAMGIVGCIAAYRFGVRPRRRVNRMVRSPHWQRQSGLAIENADIGDDVVDQHGLLIDEPLLLTQVDPTAPDRSNEAEPEVHLEQLADDAQAVSAKEVIVVLYLRATPGETFVGTDIRAAAESVGMRYGAMGVFHHFGVGQMQSGESLFCLANMFEPGNFDLSTLSDCKTQGLAMLMRLPLQIDGAVAFELLLNTAYRLQKRLGGELANEHRQNLSADDVARLRAAAAGVPGL